MLTNYWTQSYLPPAAEFDSNNDFYAMIMRIIDGSSADFDHMAGVLASADQARVQASSLFNLVKETQDLWRHHVRSSADTFVQKSKEVQA